MRPPTRFIVALALVLVGATGLPRSGRGDAAMARPSILTLRAPPAPRVWYPGGTFRMGSSPEEVLEALTQCANEPLAARCPDFSNEQPQRSVFLSPFGLDTREVSVAHYTRCVAARRCRPIPYHRGARRFARSELPVVLVTHSEAESYCSFVGGTLPTEAQFERASRGLTRRRFPWGNTYHRYLSNHGRLAFNPTEEQDGSLELAATSSYPDGATPEGVLNLAGNAAEWVLDSYSAYYDERDTRDPRGPGPTSGNLERVIRGGGYLSPVVLLRGAARQSSNPDDRNAEVGFRCAYPARGGDSN